MPEGDIHETLCWRGPASVNVFVVGAGNTPLPAEAFHLAGLVPDDMLPFVLMEQPAAVEPFGLISYDLDFEDTSLDLREYTRAALARLCEDHRAVAWAGFEGSIHYDHLLTDEVARQIYGYCASGTEPVIEWDLATLRTERWRRRLTEARAALDALLAGRGTPPAATTQHERG
ncbi:hypothetical protein OG625_03810 [Streptomyces sp. NBC_01351]|uniref:hypothetical protein n=1 Tax=Streptomyces sp. NBC_01351 TaxID=2903833 RepID=UPI002E36810C|nr:hypothetical protein [Streptomyces sp. NBC_01351]